ncbi:MAG: transcriptional repressor [Clostridiales bacterium]|jgi:Fur family peroxide stress response transcriptional regulator|nr:transcriptional repressor [Clostridiales bacterium]
MIQRRLTWQKEAVKNELKAQGHPTAEELYTVLHGKYPELSRATVYRNLRVLEGEGEILRVIGVTDGGERFDATIAPHGHFICLKCGAATDVEIDDMSGTAENVAKRYGVKIIGHRANFYGYCEKCCKVEN